MTIARYPGDVAIPTDQPLLGRCGACGRWTVYAHDSTTTRPLPHGRGVILTNYSTRGGPWTIQPDGSYRRNRDPDRWGARSHLCPHLGRGT